MATLVSDLIQGAYEDVAVVQVGETISTTLQTSGFNRLNQLVASLSAEGATIFTEQFQSFALSGGQPAYTVGVSGSLPTAKRAQKITSWKATSGGFTSGGAVLNFPDFEAAAQALYLKWTEAILPFYVSPALLNTSSACPLIIGADTAWPLINLRVFPAVTASVELGYWTPMDSFVTVGDTVNLPPGFELLLRSNLAVQLYQLYARVSGMSPELAALAQNSKAVIIQQNIGSVQQPAAGVAQ